MFDSLFGAEMPLAVRFFLAFLIVLALIGVTAWAVRRFGSGRLGGGSARGRQPRLAVIDYASVDGRRRLILVRRDNVEHLLMIGGPTDVVVEPNIVRAVAAPRDLPMTRPAAGLETLPRAIPLPETGNGGSWPLQPEPAGGPRPLPRVEPLPDDLPRALAPEPPLRTEPPRPQRDTLAALADELSARHTSPRSRAPAPKPVAEELPAEEPIEVRAEPRQDIRAEPRPEPRKSVAPPPAAPAPVPTPAAQAPAPVVPPAPVELAVTPDQSLADMAQRLEAALRRPTTEARAAAAPPRATPAPAPEPPAADTPPRPARPPDAKTPRADAKPKDAKAALYDNLEQEMASLLGRPTKT